MEPITLKYHYTVGSMTLKRTFSGRSVSLQYKTIAAIQASFAKLVRSDRVPHDGSALRQRGREFYLTTDKNPVELPCGIDIGSVELMTTLDSDQVDITGSIVFHNKVDRDIRAFNKSMKGAKITLHLCADNKIGLIDAVLADLMYISVKHVEFQALGGADDNVGQAIQDTIKVLVARRVILATQASCGSGVYENPVTAIAEENERLTGRLMSLREAVKMVEFKVRRLELKARKL